MGAKSHGAGIVAIGSNGGGGTSIQHEYLNQNYKYKYWYKRRRNEERNYNTKLRQKGTHYRLGSLKNYLQVLSLGAVAMGTSSSRDRCSVETGYRRKQKNRPGSFPGMDGSGEVFGTSQFVTGLMFAVGLVLSRSK